MASSLFLIAWLLLVKHVSSLFSLRAGAKSPPLESLRLEDIAFGVLTCDKFYKTRFAAQRETWLRHVKNYVVFSEQPAPHDGIDMVIDTTPQQQHELMNHTGAARTLSMVKSLYLRFPTAKWFFFVDDDTYVFVPTLLHNVLGSRDPSLPHYIGFEFPTGPNLKGLLRGEWQPHLAHGGAGVGISAALMTHLVPHIPQCEKAYTWDWPGDFRLAKCIDDLGYNVESDLRLYPERVETELEYYNGTLHELPPASFHHLTPKDMQQLYAGSVAFSRDGRQRADFSKYFMRDLISPRDSVSNLSFKLRFGLDLHVASNSDPQKLAKAGQLLHFHVSDSLHPAEFLQEYNGSCPWNNVRPLTVVLRLQCSGDHRSEEEGSIDRTMSLASKLDDVPTIEHVLRKDVCSFELLATGICPAWEANTAIMR